MPIWLVLNGIRGFKMEIPAELSVNAQSGNPCPTV
jgi:hypothetical protein